MAAVVACDLWAGRRLLRTAHFFDEWTLIAQALHRSPWDAAFASFNGHLWLFQDAVYRLQLLFGGVDVRWIVVTLHLAAIAGMVVGIAGLTNRAGLPLPVALVLGAALTVMGMSAQNWVFAVQWAAVGSMALSLGACRVVVDGGADRRRMLAVTVLTLAAVVVESGAGTIGMALVAGVSAVCWRRRAVLPLMPATTVLVVWYALADLGPEFPASVAQQGRFALSLLTNSAGAVVGLGPWPGAVLVAAVVVGVVLAVRSGVLSSTQRAVLLGGCCSTVVSVAAIARSRAGLPGFTFFDSNRYLQAVGVPLAVAASPLLVAVIEHSRSRCAAARWRRVGRWGTLAWPVVSVLLLAGAVSGQRWEARWSPAFLAANRAVHDGVRSAAVILSDGCPGGGAPPPEGRPLGAQSPQITVGLVAELVDRGLLRVANHASVDTAVDPAVLAAICP